MAQSCRPILDTDDTEGLLARLAEDAAALLEVHLPSLLAGSVQAVAQAGPTTYAPKLDKAMARLDVTRPAAALHRQVRALQPWPAAELTVDGQILKVLGVGPLKATSDSAGTLRWDKAGAFLACGDGQALELAQLQRAGKPVQAALQALQPWGGSGSRVCD